VRCSASARETETHTTIHVIDGDRPHDFAMRTVTTFRTGGFRLGLYHSSSLMAGILCERVTRWDRVAEKAYRLKRSKNLYVR
jgi:hypothetical protein